MRARSASWLVRWASAWIHASFNAHMRARAFDLPGYARLWHWGARQVCRVAIPLALRLDRGAAGQQMVEEAWWG